MIGYDIPIPLDVELIRPGEGEVPTAIRLLERVFKNYPRYFDAIAADALYLEEPFFNFCIDHNKHVVAVLKKNQKELLRDGKGLFGTIPPEQWKVKNLQVKSWDHEGFEASSGIKKTLRILHTEEKSKKRKRIAGKWVREEEEHNWWWATTIPKSMLPTKALWEAAHARWQIENNLFHNLSTYWALDHCYKHDPVAIINFILTLFIAFVLVETFYRRNLKPQARCHFTVIGITGQLYMGLAILSLNAPWVTRFSGPAP